MVNNVLPEPYMIYRLGNLLHILLVIVMSLVKTLWPLLRNLSCSQDQDHIHSTYIYCSYTWSMQQHVFHPPKIFYSYTRNRHKNMFDRINAPSSCKCLSWKVLIAEKRHVAMQKLFKEKVLKIGQVFEILKTMGTQMPAWKKREMNKIAHVFLQSVFQVSIKRDMFQGA